MPRAARSMSSASGGLSAVLAVSALSFCTYFCMYAFRKPFAAGQFIGPSIAGLEPKTLFVISQLIGYATSKFVAVRWVTGMQRQHRFAAIVTLVAVAESALVAFSLLPPKGQAVAMFCNGLPLGMIWSLVVRYLEGRRKSDILLAALSCSFIVASGAVKDVGRALLRWGVPEQQMPALTGALFFPILVMAARALDRTPEPDELDIIARESRRPMSRTEQKEFLLRQAPGLLPLLIVYLILTGFRDYRDNFGVELFDQLGYGDQAGLFSQSELLVAVGVLVLMANMVRLKTRLAGLVGVFLVILVGLVCVGASCLAFEGGLLSGQGLMIGTGLGAYLAYVPFSSFLFDRLMAATHCAGTAVFAVNLADAVGYSGSTAMQLYKDLAAAQSSSLQFFTSLAYALSAIGTLLVGMAGAYFLRQAVKTQQSPAKVRCPGPC